ncbi:MAG: hypothetical protein WDO56_26180 [Gammaproteobacteria bacterium]
MAKPSSNGDNNTVLFNLMGGDYNYFEGITIRNTGTAIEAGMKGIAGSKGLTVKHVKFENLGTAVHSDWSGSSGFYIADNDMLGREDLSYVFTWYGIKPWVDRPDFAERGKMKSFYAVSIYGQGHIMAYNRVRGFHDGLDHATYGMPDDYPNTPPDRLPVGIDVYNNDVSVMHDNCFETDGAVRNNRVLRNRCFNAVLGAMSPQPVFGGPVYFIRNVVYNAWWGPVKIHGEPSGIYYLNNTYVGEFKQLTPASNFFIRNNLILGQGTAPRVFSLETFTNYSSSDYNGFRPNPGSKEAFAWNSPPFDEVRNFYPAHKAEGAPPGIPLTQRPFAHPEGIRRCDRAGPPQQGRGLRHLRERAKDRLHRSDARRRGRLHRSAPEEGRSCGRCRCGAPEHHRWISRARARSRRLRVRRAAPSLRPQAIESPT